MFVLRGAVTDIGRRLMDAVDPGLVDTAESSLRSVPGVQDVEQVQLRWVGHRMRAETGVVVDPDLNVVDAHHIAVQAHHRLLYDLPRLIEATVHVSPGGQHGIEQHQKLDHHR